MDGRDSRNDDRNRLAEVERQLAELRAEVEELRREIQRLSDGTRARPSDEIQQGSAGDVPEIVLTVLVSAERPSQGGQVSPALSGLAEKLPRVPSIDMPLRSTVVVHAPSGRLRGWESDMPAPAPLKEQADRLLDGIRERLATRATETGLNPVWDAATTEWYVTDFGGFERVAEMFGDLDNWGHQAVAAWVGDVGRMIDMPTAVAGDVGEVIGLAIPLPIDRPLIDASRVIQVAGVAFAAATGNMPLACASLKSLAHDRLIDFMAKRLLNAATGRGNDRTSPGQEQGRASGRPVATKAVRERRSDDDVQPRQVLDRPPGAGRTTEPVRGPWRGRDFPLRQDPGRATGRPRATKPVRERRSDDDVRPGQEPPLAPRPPLAPGPVREPWPDQARGRTPAEDEPKRKPRSRESGF